MPRSAGIAEAENSGTPSGPNPWNVPVTVNHASLVGVVLAPVTAIPASPTPEQCARQIGTIWINGTAIDPAGSYRVTMNNFLASGGDGFTVFNSGTDVLGGAQDIDSFAAYLAAAGTTGVPVPTLGRIVPKP